MVKNILKSGGITPFITPHFIRQFFSLLYLNQFKNAFN
jgi:hypothetical protein